MITRDDILQHTENERIFNKDDAWIILYDLLGEEAANMLIETQPLKKQLYTISDLVTLANKEILRLFCQACQEPTVIVVGETDHLVYHVEYSINGSDEKMGYFCSNCYYNLYYNIATTEIKL